MSAAAIHALGLREVERINGLLTDLAIKAGYKDLNSFRAALNNDPKYIPNSPDQILDDFRHYVGQMQPRLPELFGVFPKTPLTVEAAPASHAQQSHSLCFRDCGWQSTGACSRCNVQLRTSKIGQRRSTGLSRRHSRSSPTDFYPATAQWPVRLSSSCNQQCIRGEVGGLCRGAR